MAENIKSSDRAIRPEELRGLLGISKSSIYRLEQSGALPKKRRYAGGTSCFYMESEIIAFMKNQPQVDCLNKTTPQIA